MPPGSLQCDTTFPSGAPGAKAVNGTTHIHTTAVGNGTTCALTTCPSQLASAAVFQGNFAEIKVPWSQIGGKPTGGKFLRFTVSTLYDNHTVPADGYNSPVIDVLGTVRRWPTCRMARSIPASMFTSTPTARPTRRYMVTEFQPNPIGKDSAWTDESSTETEWIEVYNPNSFAIPLSDYKVSNTPKRGSTSQGVFKFKASQHRG